MTSSESSSSDSTTPHKLWGGRFAASAAPELDAINRSINVDLRLWPFDIQLSKAWAQALVGAKVLSPAESDKLIRGLDAVAIRIRDGAVPSASDEDVHTLIDRLLHEEAGDVASRLHTGRSRNDQVATASRLWAMQCVAKLDGLIRELQRVMVARAEELVDTIMPAYTHLQRAQPVSAAHWMLAHFWPLERDRSRLAAARRSASVLPLGAGAVAGSAFPVSRQELKAALGFDSVSENSMDAVGDRDFVADLLYALTMIGIHLSRLAEDLILFGSSEFGFVRFNDAFSTGSSMMPQKRNPDALELARATGGRVTGDLVALLATLKGLPTGYNKDLQEDKRALFDAADALVLVLPAVAGTIGTLEFRRDRMAAAVSGSMMATDLADYLVRRGISFRAAHGAVGQLVREAETRECELGDLPISVFQAAHSAFAEDVTAELDPRTSIAHRNVEGGTGPESVQQQLEKARAAIN